MATGWIELDGKCYYLDPATGAMYANTRTPDNFWVDASGVCGFRNVAGFGLWYLTGYLQVNKYLNLERCPMSSYSITGLSGIESYFHINAKSCVIPWYLLI